MFFLVSAFSFPKLTRCHHMECDWSRERYGALPQRPEGFRSTCGKASCWRYFLHTM